MKDLRLSREYLLSLDVSPDGEFAAVGDMDDRAHLMHLSSGEVARTFETGYGAAWSVRFSPSGRMLALGGTRCVRVVEPLSGAVLADLEEFNNDVFGLAFSGDEKLLATACLDAALRVFTVRPLDVHDRILTTGWGMLQKLCCGRPVRAVEFGADARTLSVGCEDGTLRRLDAWNGRHRDELERSGGYPLCLSQGWCGWSDGWLTRERVQLQARDGNVTSVAASRDGVWLADAAGGFGHFLADGSCTFWREKAHEGPITGIALAGERVLTVGWDGCCRCWSALGPDGLE